MSGAPRLPRLTWMWIAWSDDKRICDCGIARAETEQGASSIAAMAVGGPHMREVTRFEIKRIGLVLE